jgi:hypothetical protein
MYTTKIHFLLVGLNALAMEKKYQYVKNLLNKSWVYVYIFYAHA